jgi:hypothetical protein
MASASNALLLHFQQAPQRHGRATSIAQPVFQATVAGDPDVKELADLQDRHIRLEQAMCLGEPSQIAGGSGPDVGIGDTCQELPGPSGDSRQTLALRHIQSANIGRDHPERNGLCQQPQNHGWHQKRLALRNTQTTARGQYSLVESANPCRAESARIRTLIRAAPGFCSMLVSYDVQHGQMQTNGPADKSPKGTDTLSIELDGRPDCGRGTVFKSDTARLNRPVRMRCVLLDT